ncbi:MAG TPA: hypothetical protein VMF91_12325 [Bryobacteraceae bacterium]|nr:hypothetical protein [Bryobacteraceae bacterium]
MGHNHLDLPEADAVSLHVRGQLAVRTLQREESHVIVARRDLGSMAASDEM